MFKEWFQCCFPSNRDELKIIEHNPFDDNDNNPEDNANNFKTKSNNEVGKISQPSTNTINPKGEVKDLTPPLNLIEQQALDSNTEDNLASYQFKSIQDQVNYALAPGRKQFTFEEFLPFLTSRRTVSLNDIDSTPLLIVKEQLSETPQNLLQSEVIINASGLINSTRKAKDGIVVFCKKELQRNPSFLCDYELNITDDLFYLPYVFVIYYSSSCYFISPHKSKGYDNYLPLIQLSKELIIPIKNREIFSIGSETLMISPNANGGIDITNMEIASDNVENKAAMWSFHKEKKEITIGKGKNCDIAFVDDKVLSRVHCTLCFNGDTWIMKDGSNGKGSTNGTFFFCLKPFRIINNMSLRLLNSDLLFTFKSQ